jgi:hypothetical protein
MSSEYLEEDLVSWGSLGIYHRPSQYGFLTTLQQMPPEGEWPESEDPITLFGDLLRMLQLPSGERMSASGGLGNEGIFKCLAAPAGTVDTRLAVHYDVMKTLGYVPHYWHWGRGMGEEWKGATEPDALETAIAEQSFNKCCGEDASFDKAGLFEFPGCSVGDAKLLYRHIRQHCRDWRTVYCNIDADGFTPVFFVGESKVTPHRWAGYAGQKCWM